MHLRKERWSKKVKRLASAPSMFPTLPEPKTATEFELQAELYSILKAKGYNVRGEVGGTCKYGRVQFDLVVFSGSQGACIIEVKDRPHEGLLLGSPTRQTVRYAEFGIPVIYYTTLVPLVDVLNRVREIVREGQ